MRLTLLGSGSSGNVAFLEAGGTRVLVDAGLPRAEVEARLERVGHVSLASIDAVLLTHEHGDHAGHAAALERPIWATASTRRCRRLDGELIRAGVPFTVGAFTISPVLLPHDADETVGFVLAADGARVGILTDCGHDSPEVAAGFAGCDVLVLETNHDPTLLKHGSYPPSLKRRVGGRLGHLSNDQAASLLKQMIQLAPAPKLVIAAHISQVNNRLQLAKSAIDRVLSRASRSIVATQPRPTPVVSVENGRVTLGPLVREQLSFAFSRADEAEVRP